MREYRVGNYGLTQAYAAVVGIVLVAVGLLGFINNPIVGPDAGALFATNGIHNIVHLATGLLALYIAFRTSGQSQANWVIGFGVLYAVIFVVTLLSPTLFGLFDPNPVNALDHVLHAGLAVASLAVGYLGRGSTTVTSAAR
jgi:hypothetical protein